MTIYQEDVQRLVDSEADDPVLVVLEGRTLVLSAADLDEPEYRGALRVASKADITGERSSLSEQERKEVAARLDTEVSQLGG